MSLWVFWVFIVVFFIAVWFCFWRSLRITLSWLYLFFVLCA